MLEGVSKQLPPCPHALRRRRCTRQLTGRTTLQPPPCVTFGRRRSLPLRLFRMQPFFNFGLALALATAVATSQVTTGMGSPAALAGNHCEDRCHEGGGAIACALLLRKQGNGAAALACLEQARTALPNDPTLLTDLGIQAYDLHHLSEAADALQTSLTRLPGNPTAQYALARVELDRQHMPQAEGLFREYLAQQPQDASAHYGLGHLLQMLQHNDEAAAEFHRSIDLQPAQTESFYQLGQMDLDLHRDGEARELFNKVLGRFPAHGGALTGIGILNYRAKAYIAARASLQAAITASPDYQPAHYYLGLTLARLGDAAASSLELQRAAELTTLQQGKSAPISGTSAP